MNISEVGVNSTIRPRYMKPVLSEMRAAWPRLWVMMTMHLVLEPDLDRRAGRQARLNTRQRPCEAFNSLIDEPDRIKSSDIANGPQVHARGDWYKINWITPGPMPSAMPTNEKSAGDRQRSLWNEKPFISETYADFLIVCDSPKTMPRHSHSIVPGGFDVTS